LSQKGSVDRQSQKRNSYPSFGGSMARRANRPSSSSPRRAKSSAISRRRLMELSGIRDSLKKVIISTTFAGPSRPCSTIAAFSSRRFSGSSAISPSRQRSDISASNSRKPVRRSRSSIRQRCGPWLPLRCAQSEHNPNPRPSKLLSIRELTDRLS
jgi:hypothetical protein